MLGTKVAAVQDLGDAVEVTLDRQGAAHHERFSHLLVAVGRRPASRQLGLEHTAVEVNGSGFIVCDRQGRTADPQILAIGDVAGEPMLAHKATHQAKLAD